MLDPATIGLAIAGVRKTAQIIRAGIDASKDVQSLTADLGKLFDHTETLSKAKKEVQSGKNKSLNQMAMDIVVAEENAQKQIADIKKKLYWGNNPRGAEIFKKFMQTRKTMIRQQKLDAEDKIRKRKILFDNIVYIIMCSLVVAFGGFLIWFFIDFIFDNYKK